MFLRITVTEEIYSLAPNYREEGSVSIFSISSQPYPFIMTPLNFPFSHLMPTPYTAPYFH